MSGLSLWTHDSLAIHRHSRLITPAVGGERRKRVTYGLAGTSYQGGSSELSEILLLIEMRSESTDGWHRESARLFAIDTALTVVRRNIAAMEDRDRHNVTRHLHEARTLTVAGRDDELDFVLAGLEANLHAADSDRRRRVWITAMDALLSSPYRAALVSTRNALMFGATDVFADLRGLLRERLIARLEEGSLLADRVIPLILSA